MSSLRFIKKERDDKGEFDLGIVFYAQVILYLQPVRATELMRLFL